MSEVREQPLRSRAVCIYEVLDAYLEDLTELGQDLRDVQCESGPEQRSDELVRRAIVSLSEATVALRTATEGWPIRAGWRA